MSIVDKCKCCLEDGNLRDLWAEYVTESETEVYGEMLNECFAFPRDDTNYSEYICYKCIERLRSALSFRRDVLAAKEVLEEYLRKEAIMKSSHLENQLQLGEDNSTVNEIQEEYYVKIENTDTYTEPEDSIASQDDQESCAVEYLSYVDDDYDDEFDELEHDDEDTKNDDEQGMEVEYLEDDEEAESAVSKQIKGTGRKYKIYSQEDLQKALKMVMDKKISRADASKIYSIPMKTLKFKLKTLERDNAEDAEPDVKHKRAQFFEEIRTFLTYTNATPYKAKVGKFYCAYCSIDGPLFHNTEELRVHTRTGHAQDRLKDIECIMRPYYLNEILKVDILDLYCTVCTTHIEDWNHLFLHLKETHSVEFEHVPKRVVPYILTDDMACALCRKKFPHFHNLDSHMNAHYTNYMCVECGDTFVAENRLKKHIETHSNNKIPCPECGKVFALEKYKRKHFELVHRKQRRPFGCAYCEERFSGDYTRHLHILEHHKDRVKVMVCEFCNMEFTWRPYYLKHIKLQHGEAGKFQCKLCSKQFPQKHQLKWHEEWHSGNGYTCEVCNRRFSSKNYLRKHSITHLLT